MKENSRKIWFAWILLMIFMLSGVSVALHARHCFSDTVAHATAHQADGCSVCQFAATPFEPGEAPLAVMSVITVHHAPFTELLVSLPVSSSETLFLRGPPAA